MSCFVLLLYIILCLFALKYWLLKKEDKYAHWFSFAIFEQIYYRSINTCWSRIFFAFISANIEKQADVRTKTKMKGYPRLHLPVVFNFSWIIFRVFSSGFSSARIFFPCLTAGVHLAPARGLARLFYWKTFAKMCYFLYGKLVCVVGTLKSDTSYAQPNLYCIGVSLTHREKKRKIEKIRVLLFDFVASWRSAARVHGGERHQPW